MLDSTPTTWILVDGTRALDVSHPPDPGDARPRGGLREEVEARLQVAARAGAAVALLGPEPEGLEATQPLPPRPVTPEILPAVERLAEVGAREVTLISPLRFTPAAVRRGLQQSPVPLRIEAVGGPVLNAGVREIDLPRRVPARETVQGQVVLFGERPGDSAVLQPPPGEEPGTTLLSDSLTLEISVDGEPALSLRLPVPQAGTPLEVPVELPPFPDPGEVRLTARVHLAGDAFPLDDERVHRMVVGPPEGGVVLVSLQPDWEPRVLLPVLEAASGLEGAGFLRMGPDRWLPLGDDPPGPGTADEVERRAEAAEILVIHGAGSSLPGGLGEIAATHPRTLHLPAGPEGVIHAGLLPGEALAGEWIALSPLPPSPVAPFLAGIQMSGLPPLEAFRMGDDVEEAIPALVLSAVGREETAPGLVLLEFPDQRRAVALARGFWRWGHRTGSAREVYRSLWSGVAEWLAREAWEGAGEGMIRPVDPVVVMDTPSRWVARGSGEVTITFTPEETDPATDPLQETATGSETRILQMEAGRVHETPPLPAGIWRWEAHLAPSDSEAVASGVLEVEAWSDALLLPPLPGPWVAETVEELGEPGDRLSGAGERAAAPGRPLRTHPLPYLLLITLLCLEWVGRRRAGLR